jgi:hypothetical protein
MHARAKLHEVRQGLGGLTAAKMEFIDCGKVIRA